ncbi:hypothetical protein K7432_007190 [Basidiobolus ranarum]|uniref:Scamp-domain-containing protein n=1 Tax=Basidiobolus ranarum TaxID=34480 RepID=A0ABR2W1D9_9FUNG
MTSSSNKLPKVPLNPFEDPVHEISVTMETDVTLDVDERNESAAILSISPSAEPRTVLNTNNAYSRPYLTHDELSLREERLLQKEMELEGRERELHLQSNRLKRQGSKPNNFPSVWPVMYHNIEEEIIESDRTIVRRLFRSWLFTMSTLFLNSITCFLILIAHAIGVNTGATDFGIGLVYTLLIGAASFFLWYRPVYNAFMKEKALYYYIFFIFNGFHIGFQFYMAVGIPGSGSGGLINMISMISDGKILAGVFCIVTSLFWIVGGVLSLYLYNQVQSHYKVQGHTFHEAKTHAVLKIASNSR